VNRSFHSIGVRPADRALRGQRGAVLVLFVASLVAVFGIAGLALDGAHQMLNKSRLQNTVDAAALDAAKVLDQTGDTDLARNAAITMFADNADDAGNLEMDDSLAAGDISLVVQFSQTVAPFQPGTLPANYVRVAASGFDMPAWLIAIFGLNEKTVAATAVAGPSPTIDNACNLVPLIICGDPVGSPPFWGYSDGNVEVLKSAAGSQSEIGPGNFQLARMGGSGGAVVRENMAGGYEDCFIEDENVPTEPGNTVGPTVQGLNTRLNIFRGPMSGMQSDYPSDVVTDQPVPPLTYDDESGEVRQGGTAITDSSMLDFSYDDYIDDVTHANYDVPPMPGDLGAFQRREMPVVIADCSGSNSGQSDLPILGFGCFFLLQEAMQKGNESEIYGEFVEDCPARGKPGPDPGAGPGPYIIQLYNDSMSADS